jgi:small-conductance mechanosensitive channel
MLIFAVTYILFLIIREFDYNLLSRRWFLLVLDILAVGGISYLLKHKELYHRINKYWRGGIPFLGHSLRIICIIAIVGNVFGAVQLAQLLSYVTLGTIITLHVLRTCIVLTRNFAFLLLMGPLRKYSNILKEDGKLVLNKMDGLFNLLGSISLIFIILGLFNARPEALKFIMDIINYKLTVGETSLSLGNIIAFVLTIQISMWLSSFIRFVLEKEVFPRTDMKQGLPSTILLMIKFAFVLFGVLFAFSAAGIQIDKLAIVMGALGVGIGFGLQNIINNFVSGIILALERPMTIGDIIDIPGANGTVKDIGIRASTVRQWDGSDVIVPNGELISNKLTNWTFYDRLRRVKVDIRVPFGTNIEDVTKLLLKTAKEIPEVMKKPEPYLNFAGIGTSAMEISLYCWIKDSGSIFSLGTAIRKTVYKSLEDAGYDIPLPKQDLKINPKIEAGD